MPPLIKNKQDFPIFGYELKGIDEQEDVNMSIKDKADKKWGIISSVIFTNENNGDKNNDKKILESIIEKKNYLKNINNYVDTARTIGIQIKDHGENKSFQFKVDRKAMTLK